MKDKVSSFKQGFKKFWNYIWHDDSLGSYIANFVVAFLFIKFIFFPVVGFALNNDFPIVAIVSGSMEHNVVNSQVCGINPNIEDQSLNFDEWWEICGSYYTSNFKMDKEQFSDFDFSNGLDIGDVMILYGKDPKNIEVGEVLVFEPGDSSWYARNGPVIHRVMKKWEDENGELHFQTKGDHNSQVFTRNNFEEDIHESKVIAVATLRIPYLGYGKILLNKLVN